MAIPCPRGRDRTRLTGRLAPPSLSSSVCTQPAYIKTKQERRLIWAITRTAAKLSTEFRLSPDEKSGLSLNSVDNFAAVRVMAQIKRRSCFVLIYAGCVQTLEESEGGARRPVSRVLSLPRGQGMAIHLGRPLPGRLTRPTRMAARKPARTRR